MVPVKSVLQKIFTDPDFAAGVSLHRTIPAKEAQWAPIPAGVPAKLQEALARKGYRRLYSHQAQAYEAVVADRDVLLVTPTASGKSLSYNLPVVQGILERPESRAIYLFPTKALSQDQQAELTELSFGSELGVKIATYDGDTPQSVRASARETGQIIITNPDMLHSGVLPNHPKWVKFFRNLRWIVVDEMHTYAGLYGSHVANVFSRLRRICAFYGARPRFILCSATIGNPVDLARGLTGCDPVLIDQSGAPQGERHLVLYNPPLVDPVQGIRRGTVNESKTLALHTISQGIKTIVFARSRVRVELIADYIRASLRNFYAPEAVPRVEAYRGGYLPNERRAIEKGLRDGTIQGVVSTNALELGIDIGGLDAAILAGFPGSVASLWQQAGRAGRRQGESLALVVASSTPLDQYLVNHPEFFLEKNPEAAWINPSNPFVYLDHIKCAAFELPFGEADPWFPEAGEALEVLQEQGVVRHTGGRWHWSSQSYPAEGISLRGSDGQNVVIIDRSAGRWEVIGEMDRQSAKELLFPQAVYLHQGRQFMVHELDLEENRALVEESSVNYYTDAVVKRDIQVLYEDETRDFMGISLVLGDLLVRTQVSKYKKLRFHTHENLGYGDIHLPEDEIHTRFLALVLGEGSSGRQALEGLDEGLEAAVIARLGSLMKAVAPAFILSQPGDFGVAERLRDPHFGAPTLFVYDRASGGSGLAEAFREQLPRILEAARERVGACPCREGCPACVGPRDPEEEVGLDPKRGTKDFLARWFTEER